MTGVQESAQQLVLAGFLEAHRCQILHDYVQLLSERNSRLTLDEAVRQQCARHAGQILEDVITSLRRNRVVIAEGRGLAGEIGTSRATGGVHPVESLQAAAELFRIIISVAGSGLPGCDASSLALAALALNESLMTRIQEAASSYNSFLIDKIYSAQVEERKSIGRDLHDRVGADISIALRQLELHEMSCEKTSVPGAPHRVALAKQALVEAADDIREIISCLRLGGRMGNLDKALSDYITSAAPEGVKAEVIITGDEAWVPPNVQDEVFIVVREAMRNALTHGHGRAILARLDIAPHELRATIDDDGVGFDPDSGPGSGGTGLPSMQERVSLLNGEFVLSSSPGMGTHIALVIPLQADPARSPATSRPRSPARRAGNGQA
jgi:signal transduction histidine kinase